MMHFQSYRFDPVSGRLWQGDQTLPLRPKSVLLLDHLLNHPDRILSKSELMRAVWQHDQLDDQALFQLISEIRGVLGSDCIRTFPHRGYRWGWAPPQDDVAATRWPRRLIPAAVAAMVLAAALLAAPGLRGPSTQPTPPASGLGMSPAMSAVGQALQARSEGDLGQAIQLLELAVQANPHFAAAKVELADALRVQGEVERAQGFAHDALSDARIVGDHYLEATAHVLLSKLRLSQGDLSGALRMNAEAARIADDHGHVCAAQVSAAWQQQLSLALTQPEGTEPILHSPTLAACEAALNEPQSRWFDGAFSKDIAG